MTHRVRLAFGTLTASFGGFPRFTTVSGQLEAQIRERARDPWHGSELAALLGIAFTDADDVADRVLTALGSGRLVYEAWAPSPGSAHACTRLTALSSLAGEEAEPLVMYAVILELVGWDDAPVAGAAYQLVDPDGRTHAGTLDAEGRAEITGLRSAGDCAVCFPEFDRRAWDYISAHPM